MFLFTGLRETIDETTIVDLMYNHGLQEFDEKLSIRKTGDGQFNSATHRGLGCVHCM